MRQSSNTTLPAAFNGLNDGKIVRGIPSELSIREKMSTFPIKNLVRNLFSCL